MLEDVLEAGHGVSLTSSLPGRSDLCKIHQSIKKLYHGNRKMDTPRCLKTIFKEVDIRWLGFPFYGRER